MGLFGSRSPQFSRDGGAIGIAFGYEPLRDPRTYPIETVDLMPRPDFQVNASDEFYAKFHSLVINDKIDKSVFTTWSKIEQNFLSEYPYTELRDAESKKYFRAAMTGFLMAVCEVDVFKTFRRGEMATYLLGAMRIYIRDIERANSTDTEKMLFTGLLSGYYKAHQIYEMNNPR